ncbi:EAL domain-containing protein [Rheinheimera salexigens]
MHRVLRSIFFIVSLSFSMSVIAFEHNSLDFRFKSLGLNDGLPSTEILQTFQQSNGFMWFATDRGASRYDGKNFKHFHYSPGNDFHISNNFVTAITEDNQGNIWLATEFGLNRINNEGKVTVFTDTNVQQTGLASTWIQSVYSDSKGRLWVANSKATQIYNPGLNRFETIPLKQKAILDEEKNWANVFILKEDNAGNILSSDLHGLLIFDENDKEFHRLTSTSIESSQLIGSYISAVEPLKNGLVAVGTEQNGLFIIDFKSDSVKQIKSQLRHQNVSAILPFSDTALLIGHYSHGLSLIELSEGRHQAIEKNLFDNMSIVSNSIRNLFIDKLAQIWISTSGGVSIYSPFTNGSTVYRPKLNINGLSEKSLGGQDIYDSFYRENELWVAHEQGLDVIDLKTKLVTQNILADFVPDAKFSIFQMAVTDKGIWLALDIGLGFYHFTDKTLALYLNEQGNPYGLTKNEIYTVLPDGEGVWITGYMDVGLKYFDPKIGVVKDYLGEDSQYSIGGNYTSTKIESTINELWLATTEGVFRVNKDTGEHLMYMVGNGQNYIRARDIIEGDNGEFWVATQGAGLTKIQTQPNSWEIDTTYYSVEHGFPQNELTSLSKNGDLIWLTGTNIVISFNSKTLEVLTYPSLLNINDLSFTGNSSSIVDNVLYLGSNRGVVELNLQVIKQNNIQTTLEFTQIKAGQTVLYKGLASKRLAEDEISYADNHISFSFAALDLVNPKLNQYSFKLNGYDKNWTDPNTSSTVTYSNLSTGKYTFMVKATNSDGYWSDETLEYNFTILRPWWHFALISLILILILGSIFYLFSKKRYMRWLHTQVYVDTLTGLANRLKFNDWYDKLFNQNITFALFIIDLDYFKDVNDSYGHDVGDKYLIEAAKRMQSCIRQSDLLSRLGGDEFTVIIEQFKDNDNLVKIADKLTVALASPYAINGHEINGSASIGIAIYPDDGATSQTLFSNADSALYAAKEAGRNSVLFFNESLSKNLKRNLKIRSWFKTAIKNDEFKLFYQPKVNPKTNEIMGYEALLRCFHPVAGVISPFEVISVAEKSGDIYEIGSWIFKQACIQIKQWHNAGKLTGPVSINISAIQLTNRNFVNDIKSILIQTQAPVQFIEIELTETTLLENVEQTRETLNEIKQLGISIALDDFGVGYSSLSYLTKFPIDTLKIDRSIIINAALDATAFIVLKNIYQLALDLNIKVVAEGVETAEQLAMFNSLHQVLIQGYYYSPAVSAAEAEELNFHHKNLEKLTFNDESEIVDDSEQQDRG